MTKEIMTRTDYVKAHRFVFYAYGCACDRPCISCNGPAKWWAYQYPEKGEYRRVGELGSIFSANVEDYAAMCRTCHHNLDIEKDLVYAAKHKERVEAMKSSVRGNVKVNAMLRECTCGLITNPGTMGFHLKQRPGHLLVKVPT